MLFPLVLLCLSGAALLPPGALSANILFVATTPSVSHQIVFQAVWKELSLKGHKVHVITPNPLRDPSLTNLTEIDISSLYGGMMSKIPQTTETLKYMLKKPDFATVFIKDSFMTKLFSQLNEMVFNHTNVQKFLGEEHQFDVAVIEWLFPTMGAWAAKYKCPFVGISSLGAPVPAMDTVGNPSHPIFAPDHNLPVSHKMVFRERVMASLYAVYVRAYYHWAVLPREDALARKYLGDDLPYLGDIERNISILLLNRNSVFHRAIPLVPAIVELGGIQLERKKQEVQPELKKFLDSSKNGVIYFSLGSNMRSIYLPKPIREILRTTFAQLPYNVVWKWENETFPDKPANVFTQQWIPQLELLAHPNVKLFITQGGLQSTEDAIKNHVPIIGIPFHSDQTTNVDTCVKYGMGIALDLEDITVDNLNASIHQIIADVRFKQSAAKLDGLLHDQPRDGLQRAIWWIEYVIRHKGAKHLRSHAMDISWIQYLMLDLIAFLLGILIAGGLILRQSLRWILRFARLIFRKIFSLRL